MRVVLVNPPTGGLSHYGRLKHAGTELPLLGLAFLAKALRDRGFHADILDMEVEERSLESLLETLAGYEVLGMPVFVTTRSAAIQLARRYKEVRPEGTVVVGGPHATLFPDDLLDSAIDYGVLGEGEEVLPGLLEAISRGRDPSALKGVFAREDGSLRVNERAGFIMDLDSLGEPAVDLFRLERYYPPVHIRGKKVIHTLISRGCPYNCTFCAAAKTLGRKMRFKSVGPVIEELKGYLERGYDSVMFYDDIFTVDREHTIELCRAIIKQGLDLKWCCFTRTDRVDPEMLAWMRDAGCYLITFGCESANDDTLRLLRKGLTNKKNLRGIRRVRDAGIMSASTFMLGLPGETPAHMRNTIRFAKESGLDFAFFPIFEPYKGTEIFDLCRERGSWIRDPRHQNVLLKDQEEVWVPDTASRDEIEELATRAFRGFYLHPATLMRFFRRVWLRLPPERAARFLLAGLDYFVVSRLRPSPHRFGTRY